MAPPGGRFGEAKAFQDLMEDGSSPGVVFVLARGRLLHIGRGTGEFLGYGPHRLLGTDAFDLVHRRDLPILRALISEVIESPGASACVEVRFRDASGGWRSVEAAVQNVLEAPGDVGLLVVGVRDVSGRKAWEEHLVCRALYDPLTGLPNRWLFTDRLEHALIRTRRRNTKVAVLFVDLDDFKAVNDSLGHQAGDRVLVEVAGRLRACSRDEDTLARLYGDEFGLLIEDAQPDIAVRLARRIIETLGRPLSSEGHELSLSSSIGMALGGGGDTPEEVLREADLAMYRAKKKDRGHFGLFEEVLSGTAHGRPNPGLHEERHGDHE